MHRLWLLTISMVLGCSSSSSPGGGATDETGTDSGQTTPETPTVAISCEAPADNLPVAYDASLDIREEEFEGFPVAIVEPPGQPVGLVLYFHGSSGDAAQVLGTEVTATLNLLARDGVMLVGTESENRVDGEWNKTKDASANPDIARLLRLREHLIQTTGLTDDTPMIPMGFSNGGSMAGVVGTVLSREGLPVAATSVHNSGAPETRPDDFDHPLVVMITENDSESTNGNAIGLVAGRADVGLPALLLEGVEEPLEPERFTREGGGYTDPDVSRGVFDELVSLGLVDAQGQRLAPIENALAAFDYYEENATVGNGPAKVVSQLRVVWQMHRYNSQYNAEECAYLADALADAWAR